jgi:antitoxin YobK
MTDQITFVENELGITLPESYKKFLQEHGEAIVNGLPIYGASEDNNDFTILTATQALQFARPELSKNYLVIRFLEGEALCLDVGRVRNGDCPLIEVEFDGGEKPTDLEVSFCKYLEIARQSETEVNGALRRIGNLFKSNKIKNYDHNVKNKYIPFKARDWRVIRSCVHDYVVGLSAFCHNEQFNGLEVDVFICADHPDYEAGHGVRALISLLLSDAYKNGTLLELRFTRFDHTSKIRVNDKIPHQLVNLFSDNSISLSKAEQGIITHFEANDLFANLVGLTPKLIRIIKGYEKQERLTLQGVCYIISLRLWTIDEVNWILCNVSRPEGILFGNDVPEDRLKYEESLSYGRSLIAVSKLRHKLENNIASEGETFAQIENLIFHIVPNQPVDLDWSTTIPKAHINKGEEIAVLARPRRSFPLVSQLIDNDLKQLLSNSKKDNKKFLLYSKEFLKVNNYKKIAEQVRKQNNVEILLLQFSTNELDDEVNNRMRKAKTIRT